MSLVLATALIAAESFSRAEFSAPPIEMRRGEISLIPPEPLPFGGYTERGTHTSEPGGETLKARIIHFKQGSTSIALVSVEALTIPESLRFEVARRVWPDTHVFMVATHTHCAPDSQMLNDRMTFRIPGIAPYNSQWLDWYSVRIAGAISVTMAHKPLYVTSFELQESIETGLSRGRRSGAGPNTRATWLKADSEKIIMSFSAHATIHEAERLQTSGDWPGAVMQMTGAIVFPGAIGDAAPAIDGGTGDERVAEMARRLIVSPIHRTENINSPQLRWASEPILFGSPRPHPEFAEDYKVNGTLASIVVGRFAPPSSKLSVVALGRLLMIGVPGEPTAAVGRKLEDVAKAAGYHPVIVSNTNGWAGYILQPDDYLRGGYEATLAFHGEKAADRVVESAERLVKRLGPFQRQATYPATSSTRG